MPQRVKPPATPSRSRSGSAPPSAPEDFPAPSVEDKQRRLRPLCGRRAPAGIDVSCSDPPEPPEGAEHQRKAERDHEDAKRETEIRTAHPLSDHGTEPRTGEHHRGDDESGAQIDV